MLLIILGLVAGLGITAAVIQLMFIGPDDSLEQVNSKGIRTRTTNKGVKNNDESFPPDLTFFN